MITFILRKMGIMVPTFFGVTIISFSFIRMLPGDPITRTLRDKSITTVTLTPTVLVNTRPADLERVRLSFDYVITHQETGALICNGTTRHCATKTNGVPVGIDDQTLHLWKTFPR